MIKRLLLLLTLTWIIGVQAQGYQIEKFYSSASIAQQADSILASVRTLESAENAFESLGRREVVMRVRAEQNRYRLYAGTLKAGAFQRPLRYFHIPAAVPLDTLLATRFFTHAFAAPIEDVGRVAFDGRLIYAWDMDSLFFVRDSVWLPLHRATPPTGSVYISSQPPDAQILVNGSASEKKTPATMHGLPAGQHTIGASIPEYLFSRSSVVVLPDTIVSISFSLHSPMDTAFVKGDVQLGVLILPQTPILTPYMIDGRVVEKREVSLNEGKHRVVWEGGNRYSSLDTIVDIFAARVSTFEFNPRRLKGTISIETAPLDAAIYIDSAHAGRGKVTRALPTETYTIEAKRQGYYSVRKRTVIAPDSVVDLVIALERVPDRDHDGFLDSLDRCPDTYGLYGGCPKAPWRDAVSLNVKRVLRNMVADPFALSFNAAGFLYRRATNERFRQVLTYFGDSPHFLNNQSGLTGGNVVSASFRGVCARVELGQWNTGLAYLKSDTLRLHARDGRYVVFYDSLAGIEPRMVIPSTAIAIGVHFTTDWFNLAYTIGRQWEDIIISDIVRKNDMATETVVFDNDWWLHAIDLELELRLKEVMVPTVYASFAFPLGNRPRTGWHTLQAGMRFKFIPSLGRPVKLRGKKDA